MHTDSADVVIENKSRNSMQVTILSKQQNTHILDTYLRNPDDVTVTLTDQISDRNNIKIALFFFQCLSLYQTQDPIFALFIFIPAQRSTAYQHDVTTEHSDLQLNDN